jgi:hypothetical protein
VQAIARVSPIDSIEELGVIRGAAKKIETRIVPRSAPAWPWWTAAFAFAVAAMLLGGSAMTTGIVSGVVCLALTTYPIFKRVARVRALGQPRVVDPERANHSRVRIHYVAHVALGTFSVGVVAAHVAFRTWSSLGAALATAFVASALFGATTALAYAFIPRILTRLDRRGALPEDIADRIREARERTFTDLTGKSDLVKTIYGRILDPYARSFMSTIMLVLSGRSLRDQERVLRARVEEMLGGRGSDKLEGLDALIGDVVERRALIAERALNGILRGAFGVHVIVSALVVVLLVIHAVVEILYAK